MTNVKVIDVSANRIMEIVRELRKENINFTFSYTPGNYDYEYGQIPNHTIFTFAEAKDATYFILKWNLL